MSSIFGGISVETPKFTVVKALAGLTGAEVRKYAAQVRAEVLYDSAPETPIMDNLNTPFRALAGYIFGGNTSRTKDSNEKVAMTAPVVMQKNPVAQKIAMTAPVVMQSGPGTDAAAADAAAAGGDGAKRTMCFIMPSKYKSVSDLPLPKDARVTLVEVPERTYAAITIRGAMTQPVAEAKEGELRAAAEKEGIKLSTDPRDVQYGAFNPPWCLPWLKTNEILIPVAE